MENAAPPPLATTLPPTVNPVKQTHRWKLWVLIATILIATLASFLYFYVLKLPLSQPIAHAPAPTPISTQNSTVNWQNYTNNEIGISFQYPKEWHIVTNSEKYKTQSEYQVVLFDLPNNERNKVILTLYDNPQNLTLENLDKELTGPAGYSPTLYTNQNKKISTIKNVDAYYQPLCILDGPETFCEGYIVITKGKVFRFSNFSKNYSSSTFDQILSTFTFLGQKQSIDTSTWKTYTSKNYNYSIKYPSAWTVEDADSSTIVVYPPGAELFGESQKDTPGEGLKPGISLSIINTPLSDSGESSNYTLNKTSLFLNGIEGNYYTALGVPVTHINFDLPYSKINKTIKFSFPKNLENFSTFNPQNIPNTAKFDEETFKTIIQSFKFVDQ